MASGFGGTMANNLTLYDEADWWDESGPFFLLNKMNPGRFRFFDQVISDWQGVRVLDVGCGGGFVSEFLAKKGAIVTGMDLSRAALDRAASHAKGVGLDSIRYIFGSATELPFARDSFDAVVCFDVLEHIPQWQLAIGEFARVLRPGGRFLFDTINRNTLSSWFLINVLENTFGVIPKGTHDPRLFIKPSEIRLALDRCGFVDVTTTGFHTIWSPFSRDFFAVAGGPQSIMYIGHSQFKGN